MSDEAKAMEETAKTIGKGIDLVDKFGNFISPLIKVSLQEGIGIIEDKLKYMRWERKARLIIRSQEFMKESGLSEATRPLPLKFAVPLLEGASLEDDDYLQDMWAKLLANSVNDKCIELKRVYIDILERLTPIEGQIIEKIYSLPFDQIQNKSLLTYKLPYEIEISDKDIKLEDVSLDNPEIELSLINLDRMGCISSKKTFWSGNDSYSSITTTILGKYFYEICTIKRPV